MWKETGVVLKKEDDWCPSFPISPWLFSLHVLELLLSFYYHKLLMPHCRSYTLPFFLLPTLSFGSNEVKDDNGIFLSPTETYLHVTPMLHVDLSENSAHNQSKSMSIQQRISGRWTKIMFESFRSHFGWDVTQRVDQWDQIEIAMAGKKSTPWQ